MFAETIRRMPRAQEVARMTTAELRETFLVSGLYQPGQMRAQFTDLDRMVVGGIVPAAAPVELENHRETGRAFFLEQRELGALNTGTGPGVVQVDGQAFDVPPLACVYLGMGSRKVSFQSKDPAKPAKFFFLSCPAHAARPAEVMTQDQATKVPLGTAADANVRTIYQYIHEGGLKSCQLVMGFTELAEGSVWNTFPPHTHHRRTEVYFYFELGERVLAHFMGEPSATRHLFIHNEQAVLSPSWSIHAGCGQGNYRFIWGMAGENQTFTDMDGVKVVDLR
jgi:4-deoxy-L-threo-5-hexosulose-uronate ketol-isomerase